ncbi:class IIb bacteriocin, lactobin A/cerein 7B family [Leuconostoc lactis]|uniref:class IIb bacteriocin, lactobin A/cerein 7B family n=1 Tax=Leuconostoc lactis TaxID=1246 RepID=UPI003B27D408
MIKTNLNSLAEDYSTLNNTELNNVSGGWWQIVAAYLGYQAFEHSDQIVAGWEKAGNKRL